jgi:hypothetical protein
MKMTPFVISSYFFAACAHIERFDSRALETAKLKDIELVVSVLMSPEASQVTPLKYEAEWDLDVQKLKREWRKFRSIGAVRMAYFPGDAPSTYEWRASTRRLSFVAQGIVDSDLLAEVGESQGQVEVRLGRWVFRIPKRREYIEFAGFVVSQ